MDLVRNGYRLDGSGAGETRNESVAGALLSDRTVLLPGRRIPSRPLWVVFRNTGLQWDMESVQAKTAFDSSKEGATICRERAATLRIEHEVVRIGSHASYRYLTAYPLRTACSLLRIRGFDALLASWVLLEGCRGRLESCDDLEAMHRSD